MVGAGQGGGPRHAEPFDAACPDASAQCDQRRAPPLAWAPARAGSLQRFRFGLTPHPGPPPQGGRESARPSVPSSSAGRRPYSIMSGIARRLAAGQQERFTQVSRSLGTAWATERQRASPPPIARRKTGVLPDPLWWGRDRVGGRAMPSRLALARTLRRNATSTERRLWQGLRREQVAGFRFRRQVVLKPLHRRLRLPRGANDRRPPDYDPGGDCATHSTDEEMTRDAARSATLRAFGFDGVRFTNDDVFRNLGGVLETIRLRLAELRRRIDDSTI